MIPWLVEHAAYHITTFGIGRHGKEPYRLLKGRSWTSALFEFGEGVQFKPPAIKGRFKLDTRLRDGVYLGVNRKTGESCIGTPEGIKAVQGCL